MQLTPEERKRIYEEEKVRVEAQSQIKAENSKKVGGCVGIGCLSLVGIFVVLWIMGSLSGNNPSPSPDSDKFGAYFYSKEFVKEQLRAPSTAKFCDFDEARISSNGANSYTVVGWVDAQNGFGAMLRNRFVCKLHKNGDTWYRDDVSLLPR
jgi:hypothetical protein